MGCNLGDNGKEVPGLQFYHFRMAVADAIAKSKLHICKLTVEEIIDFLCLKLNVATLTNNLCGFKSNKIV